LGSGSEATAAYVLAKFVSKSVTNISVWMDTPQTCVGVSISRRVAAASGESGMSWPGTWRKRRTAATPSEMVSARYQR